MMMSARAHGGRSPGRVDVLRRALVCSLLAVVGFVSWIGPAAAADLDRLRAEGIVAERYDGYVEVRVGGHPEAQKLVDKVNAERRHIYRERAQDKGVPVEQVGRVYAREIFRKLPAGAYFRREDGSYVRKQ